MSVAPTKSPNRLGVLGNDLQGFPNGRRLTDDVIDISLQAVEGAAQSGKLVDALAAGDKVNANDRGFESAFPYLALPNANGVNTRTSVKSSNVGFLGSYSGGAPMAVGGLAALVALGGFMASWYRRRERVAVAAKAGGGTTLVATDGGGPETAPQAQPTHYSGRRRAEADQRPEGGDPGRDSPGDSPGGDGYVVI